MQSTPFELASKYETGIVNAYFAVVVQYGDQYERYGFQDLIAVEPAADGDVDVSLRNLEYDVTRAIKKVVSGFHATADLWDRVDRPVRLLAVMSPARLPEVFAEIPDAVRSATAELAERATENVHAEAKIREVETELSVAQASTDMIATGVLDYRLAPDQEEGEVESANEDDKADVSKTAT